MVNKVGDMKEAINLVTGNSIGFSGEVHDAWAVIYPDCEEKKLLSKLFALMERGGIDAVLAEYPVIMGRRTIRRGNWCVIAN